jgi:hypothetical protein
MWPAMVPVLAPVMLAIVCVVDRFDLTSTGWRVAAALARALASFTIYDPWGARSTRGHVGHHRFGERARPVHLPGASPPPLPRLASS